MAGILSRRRRNLSTDRTIALRRIETGGFFISLDFAASPDLPVEEMKTGKHVIFLGAGASKGSGYPLANELRLLMSSRKEWEKALKGYGEISGDASLISSGLNYWDSHANALDLFRNGGFATLDEFCKLAGSQFQDEINGL